MQNNRNETVARRSGESAAEAQQRAADVVAAVEERLVFGKVSEDVSAAILVDVGARLQDDATFDTEQVEAFIASRRDVYRKVVDSCNPLAASFGK